MDAHEFYCLTAAEYILKARGHARREIRLWEHTREICHVLSQVHSTKVLPPSEVWWPLPTDRGRGGITEERLMAAWDKARKRHGAGTQNKD